MGGRGNSTSRGSSKFNATAAALSSSSGGSSFDIEGYDKAEQAFARKLFGKPMSGSDIANLAGAGAFSGAKVEIGLRDGRLQVDISHKYISKSDGMTRTMYRDADGKLTVRNDAFFLSPSAQGKGLGTKSFSTQVADAQKAKVSYISTFALRNDARSDKSVGYKVWADLGYDGKLSGRVQTAWANLNPLARFDGTKTPRTIRELYATRGGKTIWHTYGESQTMVFSLSRGSKSVKTLNSYLKGKTK